ncbi:hypothetical protein C8R43DRAFT_1139450 [Mycena crocata]|nr:hypothetical protein C8R43DRAFT_1139450 [Mycena crocata]
MTANDHRVVTHVLYLACVLRMAATSTAIPVLFDPTPSASDLHARNVPVFEVVHSVGANGKLTHITRRSDVDEDVVGISWATDELEYRGSGLTAPIRYILGQKTWTLDVGPFSLVKEGTEWKLSQWIEGHMVYAGTIGKVQFVDCNHFHKASVMLVRIEPKILDQMGEWKDTVTALMITCSLVEAVVTKGIQAKL